MSGRRAGSDRPAAGAQTSLSRPRERAIAARLRRLDTAAGRQFVADLWAARGYEIHSPENGHGADGSGGAIEATRGNETMTLGVVSPSRLGATPLPALDHDAIVVLGDPASVADRVAGDTRVLGAGDLAEMLLYAVDRPVAGDLCERHLGAPPERLGLPVSAAIRERARWLGSPTLSSGLRVAGVGFAVVLVALALATLGGSGAPGPATPEAGLDAASSGTGEGSEAAAAVSTEDGGEFPETYPPGTADLLPPGVTREGIEDAAALGRAHSQHLEGRSYAFTITRYQPAANGSATPAQPDLDRYLFGSIPQPGVTHTTQFAVAGDAYRSRASLENEAGARVRAGVYFTDGEWYVAAPLYGNTSFRSAPVSGSVGPGPDTYRTELVDRYLSSPETELTGVVDRDGRRLYRIVANGTPRPFPDLFTRNYTAVALVDSRGVVHDLSVSYAIVSDDDRAIVETSVSYGSFGEVAVRPPPWYINRFDGR
jgi:hypothetical protein